jgi:hypothetical protein
MPLLEIVVLHVTVKVRMEITFSDVSFSVAVSIA